MPLVYAVDPNLHPTTDGWGQNAKSRIWLAELWYFGLEGFCQNAACTVQSACFNTLHP